MWGRRSWTASTIVCVLKPCACMIFAVWVIVLARGGGVFRDVFIPYDDDTASFSFSLSISLTVGVLNEFFIQPQVKDGESSSLTGPGTTSSAKNFSSPAKPVLQLEEKTSKMVGRLSLTQAAGRFLSVVSCVSEVSEW